MLTDFGHERGEKVSFKTSKLGYEDHQLPHQDHPHHILVLQKKMPKIFVVVLLVGCVGVGNCDDDPAGNTLDAPEPPKPCSCILPVVLLPGGGALPGGISSGILNGLLAGGILNNNNVSLTVLKLILANPSLLNNPTIVTILGKILGGGGGPITLGLLKTLLCGIPKPGPAPAPCVLSGILNGVLEGGIGNVGGAPPSFPTYYDGGIANGLLRGGLLNSYPGGYPSSSYYSGGLLNGLLEKGLLNSYGGGSGGILSNNDIL